MSSTQVGLKNAAEFSKGLKAAYDDNFRTGVGFDINQKELATFEHMDDEMMLGVLADKNRKADGAPSNVELMAR